MSIDAKVRIVINGREFKNLKQYCWLSDVLQLGDDFACTVGNPDGVFSGYVSVGQDLEVYVSDPDVSGGAEVKMLRGLVTRVEDVSDEREGTYLVIQGADLGWHLTHTCGPLWLNLRWTSWRQFFNRTIDPAWGFAGVTGGNLSRPMRQGRAGAALKYMDPAQIPPPMQFEPGQTIASVIIERARLERRLVNVSPDGYIQLFTPNASGKATYTIEYHGSQEAARTRNRAKSPTRIVDDIEGLYTDIACVGTVVAPIVVPQGVLSMTQSTTKDAEDDWKKVYQPNPNQGKFRGYYRDGAALPWSRFYSFSDGEQLSKSAAASRALWAYQRKKFDSHVETYTVTGHSQGGTFWQPDEVCEVDNTVQQQRGNRYISAVKYQRALQGGTTTTLTLRLLGLLGA